MEYETLDALLYVIGLLFGIASVIYSASVFWTLIRKRNRIKSSQRRQNKEATGFFEDDKERKKRIRAENSQRKKNLSVTGRRETDAEKDSRIESEKSINLSNHGYNETDSEMKSREITERKLNNSITGVSETNDEREEREHPERSANEDDTGHYETNEERNRREKSEIENNSLDTGLSETNQQRANRESSERLLNLKLHGTDLNDAQFESKLTKERLANERSYGIAESDSEREDRLDIEKKANFQATSVLETDDERERRESKEREYNNAKYGLDLIHQERLTIQASERSVNKSLSGIPETDAERDSRIALVEKFLEAERKSNFNIHGLMETNTELSTRLENERRANFETSGIHETNSEKESREKIEIETNLEKTGISETNHDRFTREATERALNISLHGIPETMNGRKLRLRALKQEQTSQRTNNKKLFGYDETDDEKNKRFETERIYNYVRYGLFKTDAEIPTEAKTDSQAATTPPVKDEGAADVLDPSIESTVIDFSSRLAELEGWASQISEIRDQLFDPNSLENIRRVVTDEGSRSDGTARASQWGTLKKMLDLLDDGEVNESVDDSLITQLLLEAAIHGRDVHEVAVDWLDDGIINFSNVTETGEINEDEISNRELVQSILGIEPGSQISSTRLMREKKPVIVDLAKSMNLETEGTKSDLSQRILRHLED